MQWGTDTGFIEKICLEISDLVFPSRKKVIFVHGCFCINMKAGHAKLPESQNQTWNIGFQNWKRTKRRDNENQKKLKEMGWDVLVIWECQLNKSLSETQEQIRKFMKGVDK